MKRHATFRYKKLPQYPSWPDLSDHDVHQVISKQLAALIPDTIQGYKCDQSTVCDVVLKASVEGCAIEGTCNDLAAAPTGVTIRTYLNAVLPVAQLKAVEQQLCTQLQADLPRRLWRAPLA